MMYEDVVGDFARRTVANLAAIRHIRHNGQHGPVYEVTQLVNSMLGLLVFPQQKYVDRIPETSLADLESQGWPVPRVIGAYPQVANLRQLVRMLRNAIAHFNLKFIPGSENEIAALTVRNTHPKTHAVTWKAELSVEDLESITQKFVELLLNRETY